MNRLQLATLLSWAGDRGIQGRKRLQKIVFFLQQAGCDLGCRYTLHYFGPYSRDVADACDEMVAAQLIDENVVDQSGNKQYAYTLKPQTRELLRNTPENQLKKYQSLGKALVQEGIWSLELGSTILFFYRQSGDWHDALAKACTFKKSSPDEEASRAALALAQRVATQAV